MAKTESTAVNELIELMQSGKPAAGPEPAEDMFTAAPPRMTATVPPINAAGEVAPLPRTRAPQGTQRLPVLPPPVRVSTAPPSRSITIPPIPSPAAAPITLDEPEDSLVATTPNLGAALRASGADPRSTLLGSSAQSPLPRASSTPAIPPPIPSEKMIASGSVVPHDPRSTTLGHSSGVGPINAQGSVPPFTPRSTSLGQGALPSIPPVRKSAPLPPPRRSSNQVVMIPAVKQVEATTVPSPGALSYPSAAPYLAHIPLPPDMTSHQAWFDEAAVDALEIEHEIGTARVPKTTDWKSVLPKLIMPMVLLVIAGIFVGGFFAFDGDGGQKATAATKVNAPPPKSAPSVTEPAQPAATNAAVADEKPAVDDKPEPAKPAVVVTTEEPKPAVVTPEPVRPAVGRPKFVDVRIDSSPQGATVMVVDRGKTSFLGTTPIVTALDPAREYDLVFTYPNKPTQLEHIAPAKTSRFEAILGKPGNKAKAALPVEKKVEKKIEQPKIEKKVEAKAEKKAELKVEKKVEKKTEVKAEQPVEKKTEQKKTEKTEKPAIAEAFDKPAPAADGILMISSKPPCEIFIDGAPTGLTTPQRAIKLAVGKHKITLVNTTEKIKKTLAVEITADQPTKVIQDLMK